MGGLDEAVDLDIDRYLPDRCNVVQKIRDIVRMLRILGNWYVKLLSYHPDVQTNLAAKVSTVRTVVVQLGKKSPRNLPCLHIIFADLASRNRRPHCSCDKVVVNKPEHLLTNSKRNKGTASLMHVASMVYLVDSEKSVGNFLLYIRRILPR